MVGDIEIVAIPILAHDLFGEPTGPSAVDALLEEWPVTIVKNGAKYKQFLFTTKRGDSHQVDLFLQPAPATWGMNFMIRTGSSAFSRQMMTRHEYGGHMPNGLYVKDARVWRGNELLDTPEEKDVFELWGMEFVPPEWRIG